MKDGFVGLAGSGRDLCAALGGDGGLTAIWGGPRFAVDAPPGARQRCVNTDTLLVSLSQLAGRAQVVAEAFRNDDASALVTAEIEAPIGIGCLKTGRAWVMSPPSGGRPVYYGVVKSVCGFGTRFDRVASALGAQMDLDATAVVDFMTFEHVVGDRTFLKSMSVLPPGCVLVAEGGAARLVRYAPDFTDAIDHEMTADRFAGQLGERLERSVRRACEGKRRVIVTLSGGLDSRAVIGFAARNVEVQAVTFGDTNGIEAKCAAAVAEACGVQHRVMPLEPEFLVRNLESAVGHLGGMVAARHFHVLTLAEALEAGELALDGMGGDAFTGAHLSLGMITARSLEHAASHLFHQRATAFRTEQLRSSVFDADFLRAANHNPRESIREFFRNGEAPWRGCHRFDLLSRQQRMIQCGPELTRDLLPVTTPFYGSGLPSLAARAPMSVLALQRGYLRMHREWLPHLAKLPDATRRVPVGWPLASRFAKRIADAGLRRIGMARTDGATLYADWFRGPLKPLLQEHLIEGADIARGVLDPSRVRLIAREHLDQQADHSAQIGCLLSLVTWLRQPYGPMRT